MAPEVAREMAVQRLSALHRRYLELLRAEAEEPSLPALGRLVRAHLQRIPFENISKLYHLARKDLRLVPDLSRYLDGIELLGFGGTCYSNNPHLWGLLRALGYSVKLCGADMSEPDVHTALMVRLDGREYHVDVGYAAPLDPPFSLEETHDQARALGNERWVLKPRDEHGRSRMEHYRRGELIHGYLLKPAARTPDFFQPAVADSYRRDSTFMNCVRLVRFGNESSLAITDLTVVRVRRRQCSIERLADREELVACIESEFHIPEGVTRQALRVLAGPPTLADP